LRLLSDEHLRKTGERPKIFLADLGEPQGSRPVPAYATNFFATAGIEALESGGFAAGQEAADAFRASGCKIACICAPPPVSTLTVIEAVRALKAAGSARIYLAGREPDEAATALLAAGVSEYVWTRCNALAILQDPTARLLQGTAHLADHQPQEAR
jgi:methylmalonyl-CoA mutase